MPVTVTVNDPTPLPETDNVADPVPPEERVTLFGESETVTPGEETVVESDTVPVNELRLLSWTVEVPDPLSITLSETGFVVIAKSGCVDELTATVADDWPEVDLESLTFKETV